MLSNPEVSHLRVLTQKQLELTQQMDALLQAERQALKAGDAELIRRIAAEKISQMNALEASERQRREWLHARKPELNIYDRRALLRLVAPELRRDFAIEMAKLMKALEGCRRRNQINGAIVHASRQLAERTLGVLRGQPQQDTTQPLYGRRGETVSQETSFSVTAV